MQMFNPHGKDCTISDLPRHDYSLDEDLIVVRRNSNLSSSHDFAGYHFHGSDLCVLADVADRRCYAIDFHLPRLNAGTINADLRTGADAFARKYTRGSRSRRLRTTLAERHLSGGGLLRAAAI